MEPSSAAPTDILPRDCADASTDARNELRKGTPSGLPEKHARGWIVECRGRSVPAALEA